MASAPREDYDDTVPDRAMLQEELRILEDKFHHHGLSRDENHRRLFITGLLRQCVCRHCNKVYDNQKARGDWRGFCSAKCQHARAKWFGWRPKGSVSEYTALKNAKCIGDVYVIN
jgi:hypothetical protein